MAPGWKVAVGHAELSAYSLPKDLDPPLLESDLAELIHRTSGQHRTEHLVEGRSRCDCGDCLP